MVAIPKKAIQPTVDAIYQAYENKREPARGHLGGSLIGRECERELWYSFRWVLDPAHSGRVLRLFERGQLEERTFEDNLRAAGVDVQTLDPTTGKQFRVSAVGGHFAGSLDGRAVGILEAPKTEHVLEFKTHGEKSFKDLTRNGVEKSKPEHYAQMQVYMHLSNLTRAFYLAVNKNTDELYSERIKLDKYFAGSMIDKATSIITADEPPKQISTDPTWFKCKFCDYSDVCHKQAAVNKNCRTCRHATPILNGNADWSCANNDNDVIPFDFQRTGCDQYDRHPSLKTEADTTFADLKKSSEPSSCQTSNCANASNCRSSVAGIVDILNRTT